MLSLTILAPSPLANYGRPPNGPEPHHASPSAATSTGPAGDATIMQDVAIRVLAPSMVEGIHEPRCSEPEVHILLPPLLQLKAVSERFTRLALAATRSRPNAAGLRGGPGAAGPKLEIAANMHGELRVGCKTDALKIESRWSGLSNPELDPGQVEGGEEGIRAHPSTRMKDREGDEGWAVVRVEGRDWGRVLGVGRMGGRVVACELSSGLKIMETNISIGFCHEQALILYVYLPNEDDATDESVLTVSLPMSSQSKGHFDRC